MDCLQDRKFVMTSAFMKSEFYCKLVVSCYNLLNSIQTTPRSRTVSLSPFAFCILVEIWFSFNNIKTFLHFKEGGGGV